MARVFTTTTVSIDLINNAQNASAIVEEALNQGFTVVGVGRDAANRHHYRVEIEAGRDAFAKEVWPKLNALVEMADRL